MRIFDIVVDNTSNIYELIPIWTKCPFPTHPVYYFNIFYFNTLHIEIESYDHKDYQYILLSNKIKV